MKKVKLQSFTKYFFTGILLLGLMLVSACGAQGSSASEYAGTWVSTTLEAQGKTYYTDDLVGEYKMVFDDSGSVVISNGGDEEEVKWEKASNGISLRYSDGEAFQMTKEGEELLLDTEGIVFHFEKQ